MDRKDTNKKRIVLVYEFLSEQGGLERELINHANFLKDEGYDVKVLTCHLDKKILDLLPFGGIKVEEISIIKTPVEWVNLALCFLGINNLRKHNPDLFISYSAPCNFLIRNKKNKKVNYVNHYPHFLYEEDKIEWAFGTQGIKRKISLFLGLALGDYLKRLDKRLLQKNKLIFMNSEFTKKRLEKLYKINGTVVSYPPLDPKFKPGHKKLKENYIFSSSRIIPDKKYEWLIKALSHLKNKMPLYMAGSVEPSYKESLLALASKCNVEIKFLGRLKTDEIITNYTNAKVFAFPAPLEDFGLVPAESLACGTPVVVWGDGAGPTEQIIDGVNGYWAKPYDIIDFAAKIDKCIDSKLKEKNRKKILESAKKFSYPEIKKEFVKEIDKILSKP